jgi:hypothetical protein
MNPNHVLAAAVGDHHGAVTYQYGGQGNPGTFTTSCSCGWTGTHWNELYTDLDAPLSEHGFTDEYARKYAAAGGLRAWNASETAVMYGNLPQAAGELLTHLGVTVAQARQTAAHRRKDAGQELARTLNAGTGTTEADWRASADSIAVALAALDEAINAEENLARVHVDERAGRP